MKIKTDQFCSLATSAQWQAWLYRHDAVLYQELAEHLRTSKGCSANRDKMLILLNKISAQPGGQEKLVEFTRINFPHMLEGDTPRPPVVTTAALPPRSVVDKVPFEHNQKLLTFPRRTVIEHADPGELQRSVRTFLMDKVKYDYVVIGDRAYVEYVPVEHARVAGQIPERSWLVTAWKRARGAI